MLSDPSFWYLISFVLFLIFFIKPIIKFLDKKITQDQQRFAKQLKDAATYRESMYAKLRETEHQMLDIPYRIAEIHRGSEKVIDNLQKKMRREIQNYNDYHYEQLKRRLKLFEYETQQNFKRDRVHLLIEQVTCALQHRLNQKVDKAIREKILIQLTSHSIH